MSPFHGGQKIGNDMLLPLKRERFTLTLKKKWKKLWFRTNKNNQTY